MAFWNRRKPHWDEQTDEYYADRMRDRTASDRIRILPHLFALVFVAVLFVGGIAVVAGERMFELTLTSLAQPCGLLWLGLILLVYFSLLYRQTWPALMGLGCLLLLTAAGNSYVANGLCARLEAPYQDFSATTSEPYDTVFLLGGGTTSRPNGMAQVNSSGDRVVTAARMYHAGKIREIVCTGTQFVRTTEEDLNPHEEAKQILMDLKVPEEVIEQMKGRNTKEEILNIRKWLDANPNPGRVGILSSAWHLSRVMRLADAHGVIADPIPADFISAVVTPSPSLLIPSGANIHVTRRMIKEYLAGVVGR